MMTVITREMIRQRSRNERAYRHIVHITASMAKHFIELSQIFEAYIDVLLLPLLLLNSAPSRAAHAGRLRQPLVALSLASTCVLSHSRNTAYQKPSQVPLCQNLRRLPTAATATAIGSAVAAALVGERLARLFVIWQPQTMNADRDATMS